MVVVDDLADELELLGYAQTSNDCFVDVLERLRAEDEAEQRVKQADRMRDYRARKRIMRLHRETRTCDCGREFTVVVGRGGRLRQHCSDTCATLARVRRYRNALLVASID